MDSLLESKEALIREESVLPGAQEKGLLMVGRDLSSRGLTASVGVVAGVGVDGVGKTESDSTE